MKFSNLLLSLALLLSIGSISAQSLIQGTWSNPYTTKDVSSYCCIPTSVEVYCSGTSSCTATYNFPKILGSKCWNLFMSSTSGKLTLYPKSYSYSEYYYSETTFFGNMVFNFQASNSTGSPRLNIYSASSYSSDACDFTMYSRTGK